MLLDHHHTETRMGKTVTMDSDEEIDPLASRLMGKICAARGHTTAISEYDSSESPSDRDDEVLSSAGSDVCDSNIAIINNGSTRSNNSRSREASSSSGGLSNNIKNGDLNNGLHHDELSSTSCLRQQQQSSLPVLEIREVWNYNLYEEFMQICQLVKSYPFVAMDTEFPGIVAKPMGNFNTMDEYKYQLVKCNVDLLKMIQLGVTLFDSQGNRPEGVCTWQFNFKFSLSEDLYAEESIDLLMQSGIRFDQHATEGIEPSEFAEMLLTSGLVLMDNVTWLTFHSAYDFGYLLSQLTSCQLPESETEFLETLRVYFPNMYDIKYLMSSIEHLNGGLQKVANELRVERIGRQHQAGSDSLLTGQVFFKMYEEYFKDGLDGVKYNGFICGLGGAIISTATTSTTCITNSITSTPNKCTTTSMSSSETAMGHHHHHHLNNSHHQHYLIEEMEELRVNNMVAAQPAIVH